MKAAVVYGINDLRLEEIEKPQIERDDQILVKIKAVGICGSDIHILRGANPFATYPRIMGHEMVGEVEAVGNNVKNIAVGDHIVVEPITSGADYDKATVSLMDVGKKFKLYNIHLVDAQGNEVQPNGTVTVSYQIPEGYDANNLAVYRMNEDGSKTLIKGTVENGTYSVIQKSFSQYALVEKGSTITDAQNTANSPKTGDVTMIGVFSFIALASAGAIAVTLIARKRKAE